MALINPTLDGVERGQIICDKPAAETYEQKISLRVQGTGNQRPNELWFTCIKDDDTIVYFRPTVEGNTISTGKQLVGFRLDIATGIGELYFNGAWQSTERYDGASPGSGAFAMNAYAHPLTVGACVNGDYPFAGDLYWIGVWDVNNVSDANTALMNASGSGALGIHRCPLRYSRSDLIHYFDLKDATYGPKDWITGQSYTATLGSGAWATSPIGVEHGRNVALSCTADTRLRSDFPTANFGANATSFGVGEGASSVNHRALIKCGNMVTAGLVAEGTVLSATLSLAVASVVGSGSKAAGLYAMNTTTWVEGTGTGTGSTSGHGGVTWNDRVEGAAWAGGAGGFGDAIAASKAAFTLDATGSLPTSISAVAPCQARLDIDGAADFMLKLDTESSGSSALLNYTSREASGSATALVVEATDPVLAFSPFSAASIGASGTTLYLVFDNPAGGWDTQAFVGDETAVEVTVTRNGSPVVIAGVAASGTVGVAGFTEVSIELESPIYAGETVTGVTFPAGLVEDADGRTTEGGTDEAVTNNSTASSGGPDADVGRGRLQTLPRFRGSLAVR